MSIPPRKPVIENYFTVVKTFGEFLTVAIHTILYERNIYPQSTFITARKYNYPVRQNRHPKVCKWIMDAVAAVEEQMLQGTVDKINVILYAPSGEPVERVVFDISSFPTVPEKEKFTPFERTPAAQTEGNPEELEPGQQVTDEGGMGMNEVATINFEEQFRAVFARLAFCGSSLAPLPDDSSFNVCIELKEEADPPLDNAHHQPWAPAQPSVYQPPSVSEESETYQPSKGPKTYPIRSVAVGDFAFEVFFEEGTLKKPRGRQ
ncbi:MAG: hypothetical protein M1834_005268 [Cirrosporium novae-zelandiae]|nr:MAG: hypothetical protein M1834_005268 [Cirrosporium novae-zelandiae]